MAIIGIDVSKEKVDCFWLKDTQRHTGKSKVFKNTPGEFPALVDWMVAQTGETTAQLHFVMEATGIYHEALAYALHAEGSKVSVVNPAWVRDYAKSLGIRTKTDKQDSLVLARLGVREPLRLWQPEPTEIRTLKALLARYEAVKQDHQRERNRLEKAEITQVSEVVLESIHTLLAELKKEQDRLEGRIRQHIDQHPDLKRDRRLLESIPGIGPVVSALMLACCTVAPLIPPASVPRSWGWCRCNTNPAPVCVVRHGCRRPVMPGYGPNSTWPRWWPFNTTRTSSVTTNACCRTANQR